MMQKPLAAKLRLLRAQRGLTVKDAAFQVGVDRHTLRRIELGTQEAQYPTLAKIADGYGVPVEDLLEEPVAAGKAEARRRGPPIGAAQKRLGGRTPTAPSKKNDGLSRNLQMLSGGSSR